MGIIALRMKVLPSGLDVSLDTMKKSVESRLSSYGAKNISFTEEPIAFGLKALIVQVAWPEEKSTDDAENSLKEIEGASSVEIIDYRRAFG
jgi:translation elongation factor aEF-1 beta